MSAGALEVCRAPDLLAGVHGCRQRFGHHDKVSGLGCCDLIYIPTEFLLFHFLCAVLSIVL